MSMKYLINFIETLPSSSSGSGSAHPPSFSGLGRNGYPDERAKPADLKQLLTDAKEGLEIKNTTNEFFDTLERITNELRGMTEHSTAFLARVRKADAPDYFNIIKHPMDLGTILKKVKAQQYKNKEAFKADLDLVWENCLMYNSIPSHPLRRSAGILQNRANHLLEFVTDPVTAATTNLQLPNGISRLKNHVSRLDALDASHVINSTAGTLSRPPRLTSEDIHSALSGSQEIENGAPLLHEESDSDYEDDEYFQNIEDEEEDESIKTKKGMVSLKSHPGGGRNLDLLRGLAAQSSTDGKDGRMSLSPSASTMDLEVEGRERSGSPRVRSMHGTPAPTSANHYEIPDLPGTVPGQGSALLARRATGVAGHGYGSPGRDRRSKPRTASLPPPPAAIPFQDRPALLRTPEAMGKLIDLAEALAVDNSGNQPASYAEIYNNAITTTLTPPNGTRLHRNEVEASQLIAPLAYATSSSAPGTSDSSAGSASPAPLARTRSRTINQTIDEPDMLWWQASSSESLYKAGLPGVPFASSSKAAADDSGKTSDSVQTLESGRSSRTCIKAKTLFQEDLINLKQIKKLHWRMANLKKSEKESAYLQEDSASSAEEDDALRNEEPDLSTARAAKERLRRKRDKGKDRMLDLPPELFRTFLAQKAGAQAIQAFNGTMLEHVGFDNVQRTALDAMSSLLTLYLTNLGKTMAFYRDKSSRQSQLQTILQQTLASNNPLLGEDPLQGLRKYIDADIPSFHDRASSLARRLEAAYTTELEAHEASNSLLTIPEGDLSTEIVEDDKLFGALLRMLVLAEEDHLHLRALNLDREAGFDEHEMHGYLLRRLYPHEGLDGPSPFEAPSPFIPLNEGAIASLPGLLQPYLNTRLSTPYGLWDDNSLPMAGGAAEDAQRVIMGRPEVSSANGRIMLGKRKRDVGAATAGLGIGVMNKPGGIALPVPLPKKAKINTPLPQ